VRRIRIPIVSAASLVATAILAIGLAGKADSAFPGTNGRIVFSSDRGSGNDSEIFTMRPDGSAVRKLTSNHADDYEPAWSADGRRIAFTRFRSFDIVTMSMRPDGSGRQLLTESAFDGQPAWSPDRERIAFVRSSIHDLDDEIFTIAKDGSDKQKLTHNSKFDDFPAWSPGGGRIAFDSDRDGDFDIYTMRTDGSDVRKLTHNRKTDIDPNWSPTGGRIVFLRTEQPSGGLYSIRSSDGGDQHQLTSVNSGLLAESPAYSPDANWITFEALDPANDQSDIWKMRFSGFAPRKITNTADDENMPDWGPVPP
jgi:TolB protein